jgi:ATP-binding cassette subfamily C protein CydD
MTPGARRDLAWSVASSVAAAALLVLQALVFGRIVADVFLRGQGWPDTRERLLAIAALVIVRAALLRNADVCATRAAAGTRAHVRNLLTASLLARGPAALAAERTGELANTLVGGVDALDGYVRQYLPQVVLAAAVPAVIGAAVLAIDPLSALVLGLTWPLIPLFMFLVGGQARERTRRQWIALSRMSARFLDALQGIVTLKAFGRSRDEAAAIARAGDRFRAITMGVLKVAFLSALVLELLATLSTAIVAVQIGLRLLYARIEFAPALTVLLLAPEFYRPLRILGASFHAGMAGREAGARIAELLAATAGTAADVHAPTAPTLTPARTARAGAIPPAHLAVPVALEGPGRPGRGAAPLDADRPRVATAGDGRIARVPVAVRFERVTYTYPGRVAPALADVTFTIATGSTVALVGPSGAGKSTIARLLLRFITPGSGRVLVQPATGQPGEAWPPEHPPSPGDEASRRLVTWVPQRPHLFDGTVLENLLIAKDDASAEEVAAALRQANADRFVEALPDGVHTKVGEAGARLSGGEAQRLALARAFLRDAPLVVLDEPTAHLDPESERHVADAIARLRRDRTVLAIAHRLATAIEADRVLVLAQGRIVEEGSHRELVAAGGVYARQVAAGAIAP